MLIAGKQRELSQQEGSSLIFLCRVCSMVKVNKSANRHMNIVISLKTRYKKNKNNINEDDWQHNTKHPVVIVLTLKCQNGCLMLHLY